MSLQDEYLAEYLNNPALQAKYGSYPEYRNFKVLQSQLAQAQIDNQVGIQPIYQNALTSNIVKSSKNYIKNKLFEKVSGFQPPTFSMMAAMLPKEDPVITQSRDYYSGLYGLDPVGRIQQGELMEGYSPISGGGLYTLTGGKFGEAPTVGLDKAYQKRIDKRTSPKTLERISKLPQERQDAFFEKTKALQDAQAADNKVMQQIKLANATKQQKQTIKDFKNQKINANLPAQPTYTGGGGQDRTYVGGGASLQDAGGTAPDGGYATDYYG
jgi:predicted ribosome quality control (RQC) complex YloA/Tae2 family protein